MLKAQKGFSLIELMMVIVIVSIASTIIIAQYSNSRNSKALFLGAKQIANDVRMAQNYTFSALGDGGANPSGGYGIRFIKDSNSYILFGDQSIAPAVPNKAYDVGEDFQIIKLPEGITVKSLKMDSVDTNPVDVVFAPPYGEVYINGSNKNGGGNFIDLEVEIGNPAGTEIINISSSRKIN